MPIVPTRDSFTVAPTANSMPRLRNTLSPSAAAEGATQIREMGDAVQRTAARGADIRYDMMEEANRLRVDDAINQTREIATRLQFDPETGYAKIKGYDALNRPDGVPLAEEFGGKLQEHVGSIAGTLGNDAQKLAYSQAANKLLSDFKNDAVRHEGAEFQSWSQSVREGTIKNRTASIALNYDRPNVISEDLLSIRAAAHDLARQQGKSAEWAEAASRSAESKAHLVVLETAVQKGNIRYADDYFKKYAENMDADDILRGHALLGGELDKVMAVDTVAEVLQEQRSNIVTPDIDRAFNVAIGSESAGQHFGGPGSVAGPNEPTTSPKGAIGIAQVMPGTGPEAAKMAGLEWDENRYRNDAKYNYALGKAYFAEQLRKNGGNLAKAYAAYNAGPGRLLEGMAKAEAEGQPEQWLTHMPKETQEYVRKNMKAFGAGEGTHKRPTLLDVQNMIRERIGDEHPVRLRLALDEAEKQYGTITKAIQQEEEAAVADAMRELQVNGGDYSALPAAMRAKIPPDKVTTVMDFGKRISQGSGTTDFAKYNAYTVNPQLLAQMTDDQWTAERQNFSVEDYKQLTKTRADILNGSQPEGENPGSLNSSAIKSVLDDRLRSLGIDPAPSDEKDQKGAARVGAIRQFINNSVLEAQAATGKKMNDAEVQKFVDNLFTRRAVYDGLLYDTEGPMLGMKAGDIPPQTKKALITAFKKRYGAEPADSELLQIYWTHLMRISNRTTTAQNQGAL